MLPATPAVVESVRLLVSVTAVANERLVAVVVMLLPRLLLPAPVCANPPVAVITPVVLLVKTPALAMESAPPTLSASLTVRACPVNENPPV